MFDNHHIFAGIDHSRLIMSAPISETILAIAIANNLSHLIYFSDERRGNSYFHLVFTFYIDDIICLFAF